MMKNNPYKKILSTAMLIMFAQAVSMSAVAQTAKPNMPAVADQQANQIVFHTLTAVGNETKITYGPEIFKTEHAFIKDKNWIIKKSSAQVDGKKLNTLTVSPKKQDLKTILEFDTPGGLKQVVLLSGPKNAKVDNEVKIADFYSVKPIQAVVATTKPAIIPAVSILPIEEKSLTIRKPEDVEINMDFKQRAKPTSWVVRKGSHLCDLLQSWASESGWQVSCEVDAEIMGEITLERNLPEAISKLIKAMGQEKIKARIYNENKMIRISEY